MRGVGFMLELFQMVGPERVIAKLMVLQADFLSLKLFWENLFGYW